VTTESLGSFPSQLSVWNSPGPAPRRPTVRMNPPLESYK
jgi:hypothetical protein